MKIQSVGLVYYAVLAFLFSSLSLLGQSEALNDFDTSKIEIPNFKHEVNLINKLNGYLPGTVINTIAGTPGAGSQIRSRGQASIYGDNDPLIILNGMPVNNSTYGQTLQSPAQSNRLIDINPNDITSIKWMTSAIGTSLYGSRGRNGVLLIETNKKESDKLTINFNTGVWIEKVNQLPELQNVYSQGRSVSGVLAYRGPETGEGNSWGPRISDLDYDGSEDYPYDKNGRLVQKGTGNDLPAKVYNNLDNFFVNGVLTQNHIAFVGPSNLKWMESFHGSLGHTYNGGVIPLSNFKRSTANLGVTLKPLKKLTSNIELYYSSNISRRNLTGSNVNGVMIGLLRNTPTFDITNGNGKGNDAAENERSYVLPDGSQRSYRGGSTYDSPFWSVNRNINEEEVSRFNISMNNKYQLTEKWSASLILGSETIDNNRIESIAESNVSAPVESQSNRTIKTSNLDFSSTFSDEISFMGFQYTAGINLFESSFENKAITLVEDTETENGQEEKSEIIGFYGLAQHQLFNETVEINVSIRNEYLSQLQRFDLYYGVEAKLNFWKILGRENRGFISGSFGRNGGGVPFLNALSSPIKTTNEYRSNFYSANVPFDLYQNSQFANSSLRPEKTDLYSASFYSDFFDNRFSVSYEYFNQDHSLIVNASLNPTTGYSSSYLNGTKINSTGHILTTRINNLNFFGISSSFFATFYSYNNTVDRIPDELGSYLDLPGSLSGSPSRLVENAPYGIIYGSAFERTNEGRLIVDEEGWPVQASEMKALADSNPDFLLDMGFDLKWKNFQLSGLVSILHGAQTVNGTKGMLNQFGMGKETELREVKGFVFNGVVETGNDANGNPTYIENIAPVDFYNPGESYNQNWWARYDFGGVSENNIEDLDWIRLRNIALSYTLPSFTKIFDAVVVTVSGNNLFLKSEYDGVDPELSGQVRNGYGINYFGNPNTKSYGINIAFSL